MKQLSRALTTLALLALALLIAAGCGSESKSETKSKVKAVKLGLKEDAVCIVGKGKNAVEVSSDNVNDFADGITDMVDDSKLDGAGDIDELEVDDYEGKLDPAEILALDQELRNSMIQFEADKADIEIDDDTLDEEVEKLAKTATMADADAFIEALEENSPITEDWLRAALLSTQQADELIDELPEDEADNIDDFDDYIESLRERFDEDGLVKCASGVKWTSDIEQTLVGEDDDVDLEDVVQEATVNALTQDFTSTTETTTTAAPVDNGDDGAEATLQAKRYDDAVAPLLSSSGAVVLRFTRASQKLSKGSISIKSLITAYKEQAADMKRIGRISTKVTVADGYLMKNHRTFRQAVGQLEKAVTLMSTIDKLGTEAAINGRIKEVSAAVDEADRLLTKWQSGLSADPKARSYPKIDSEWSRLNALIDAA